MDLCRGVPSNKFGQLRSDAVGGTGVYTGIDQKSLAKIRKPIEIVG